MSYSFYKVHSAPCFLLSMLLTSGLSTAHAETASKPPTSITIYSTHDSSQPMDGASVDATSLDEATLLGASDTAALMTPIPGLNLATGGGISSLPILHGLADDRNKVTVDGMALTSSCPNHMNPSLSYIAPSQVENINAMAGITPVSAGGDSIGGSIAVGSAAPLFAKAGKTIASHGSITSFYRSNASQFGVNGNVSMATDRYSIGYDGSWTHANDAHDGNGSRILASAFNTQSHNGTLATRDESSELVIRGGHQSSPYEGFPNQRMDMTGNTSNYANIGYKKRLDWGKLDIKAFWQRALHHMDFFSERNTTMPMPMNTNGTDAGYTLRADIPVATHDTLRLGHEFHLYRLDDWWPPVAGMYPSMGNNSFHNINGGKRDVLSNYIEWEKRFSSAWKGEIGLRNDVVWMDTGDVAGYSACNSGMMGSCSLMLGSLNYARDAAAFNALSHARTDINFDITGRLHYDASPTNAEEIGYARKTRSPNLYERYSWSTGAMAASMTNWFGNGAAYVGNISLKPEIANTFSLSSEWHDEKQQDWQIKVTPYYSYVQDYIDVNNLGKSGTTPGIYLLQFANHDAQMVGVDVSGKKAITHGGRYGEVDLSAMVSLVRGWRVDNGNTLYRMQPLSLSTTLSQKLDALSNVLEIRAVHSKLGGAPYQNEPETPGFLVLNWRSSYKLASFTLSAGIDNLLNKQYYDPNGGVYVSQWRSLGTAYTNTHGINALPSSGRSYIVGLTYSF